MADFRVLEWLRWQLGTLASFQIKSDCLHEPMLALVENLNRQSHLMFSPIAAIAREGQSAQARCIANHRVLGHVILKPEDEARIAEINSEVDRVIAEWPTYETRYPSGITSDFEYGAFQIDSYAAQHEKMARGVTAILAAQLLAAWTAYESLATDVWVAAVNERPMTLGVNAILAPRRADPEQGEKGPDDTASSLKLDVLREYEFDLKHSIGLMLWRKGKFDFTSTTGIRQAYSAAFCVRDKHNKSGVPKEVKDWFSGPQQDQLSHLEALRHVLVHRGGRADKPFIERVKAHPALSKIVENEHVPVDGNSVQLYTSAVTKAADVILRGVDAWLLRPESK